jgi:hypothetical protein
LVFGFLGYSTYEVEGRGDVQEFHNFRNVPGTMGTLVIFLSPNSIASLKNHGTKFIGIGSYRGNASMFE